MTSIEINFFTYLEVEKIGLGAFSPLDGFMGNDDYHSVLNTMKLVDGTLFPIPILLPIPSSKVRKLKKAKVVNLIYNNEKVATIEPSSIFKPNFSDSIELLFGTKDINHPGYKMLLELGEYFMGGTIKLLKRVVHDLSVYELTPIEVKQQIKLKKNKNNSWFSNKKYTT